MIFTSSHYQGFKLDFILLFRAKLPKTMSAPEKIKKIANDWQNAPDSVKDRYMEQQKANSDRYVNSTYFGPSTKASDNHFRGNQGYFSGWLSKWT